MIYHASFSASEPDRVADVLAALTSGTAIRAPSPPFPHGTWFVCLGDEHGTLIEVLPLGFALDPDAPLGITQASPHQGRHAAHLLLGTSFSHAEVLAAAAREGWRAQEVETGLFAIVKVWVEDRFLVEFIEARSAARYARTFGTLGINELDAQMRNYEAELARAFASKVPPSVVQEALGNKPA